MKTSKQIIQIGSLITSYHKGWHIVTDITTRQNNITIVEYQLVVDQKHKIHHNGKIRACDATYCKAVSNEKLKKEFEEKIELLKRAYDFLMEY